MSCGSASFQAVSLAGGYRTVLGKVGVGPERYPGTPHLAPQIGPFRYDAKEGLWVLTGSPLVTVSVPSAWRTHAALYWEGVTQASVGVLYSTIKVAPCRAPPAHTWVGFGGGIYVTKPSCVPLRVTVGQRSAVVRFGLGVSCPK